MPRILYRPNSFLRLRMRKEFEYSYPTELTAELLNGLIEKIVIHEATTEDGVREQNIDIYYRLIGKIE